MQKTVVKKVRLTEKEAKELARLAKRRHTTESEILREGLRGISVSEDRRRHAYEIREFISGPMPKKESWDWPDREQ